MTVPQNRLYPEVKRVAITYIQYNSWKALLLPKGNEKYIGFPEKKNQVQSQKVSLLEKVNILIQMFQ